MRAVNNSFCLWLIAAVCSVSVCGDDLEGEFDSGPPWVGETPESITREWLSFAANRLSDDDRIEAAQLVLQKDNGFGELEAVTLDTTIKDHDFLALLKQSLRDELVINPLMWTDMGIPYFPLGRLSLRTTRGNVDIRLYGGGFRLITRPDDASVTYANFFSPSLATLLEAFLAREGKLQSGGFTIDRLSGQRYVRAHIAYLEKKMAKMAGLGRGKIVNAVHQAQPEMAALRRGKALWQDLTDYENFPPTESAVLVMDAGGARELYVSIKDDEVLAQLAHAVRDIITSPPKKTDKPCESSPIGQLVLVHPDGYVEVEIHPTFFRLVNVPKEFLGPSKVFAYHSPSLAYLIDAIRASAGVPRFSDQQREAFSGEAYIKNRRAAMLDRIAQTPFLSQEGDPSQSDTVLKKSDAATPSGSRNE
jgi:hypothetical protein